MEEEERYEREREEGKWYGKERYDDVSRNVLSSPRIWIVQCYSSVEYPSPDHADSDLNRNNINARYHIYDGVRRVSGLRREPVVTVKNPTLIPTSH